MKTPPHPETPTRIDLGNLRPEDLAARMARLEGFVFLDSASATPAHSHPAGQFSILTALPSRILRGHLDDPDALRELRAALNRAPHHTQPDWGVPLGGAFGYITFEGAFTFGLYENLLIFSHGDESWFEVGSLLPQIEVGNDMPPIPPPGLPPLDFHFPLSRKSFCQMVENTRRYIAAGDIYQANLSHQAVSPWSHHHDPFLFYRHLRDSSPAPFASFLHLDGRHILSSSPELFLKISGNLARTRPIKGTRPRFADPRRDEKSAYDLITSPKEVAELVMITDLERNDLGRVCEFGSVSVTEILKLERFPQVFHLVSTVEGTLRPGVDHLDTLRACFPGGSISGAPKKRALEIITELETHPRGLYTGAIGYLGFNGESQFNIAIRTAIAETDSLHFHVGAGIVADSIPGLEFEETLHKAAGILRAAEIYNADLPS